METANNMATLNYMLVSLYESLIVRLYFHNQPLQYMTQREWVLGTKSFTPLQKCVHFNLHLLMI